LPLEKRLSALPQQRDLQPTFPFGS
jgi:hypothetical protein